MRFWHENTVSFKKTGQEIKAAIACRIEDLQRRLEKRNVQLEEVMERKELVRSYLVRDKHNDYPHGGQSRHDHPSEEHQEITELCRRICLIEGEMAKLKLAEKHLANAQKFELTYEEMTFYGFGFEE